MRPDRLVLVFGIVLVSACSGVGERVPLPSRTPLDRDPAEYAAYVAGYRRGYLAMLQGFHCVCCTRGTGSQAPSMGWDDGQRAALDVWLLRFEAAVEASDRQGLMALLAGRGGDTASLVDALLAAGADT